MCSLSPFDDVTPELSSSRLLPPLSGNYREAGGGVGAYHVGVTEARDTDELPRKTALCHL